MPKPAIQSRNLNKIYKPKDAKKRVDALIDFNINIQPGQIFGLLGPNGAGKSTFINILSGLYIKTSGDIWINGYDVQKDRSKASHAIGIVPQEITLDPFFSPYDTMELIAGLYGIPKKKRKTMELLEAVDLANKAHVDSLRLSGGMRRRLMVAKAMIHSPRILVLDEPTAGVDIELRRGLWDYVRQLNKQGTTILLTTHYLEEAEMLCDEIAILDEGQIIAQDKTEQLMTQLSGKKLAITLENPRKTLPKALKDLGAELETQRRIVIPFAPGKDNIDELIAKLHSSKLSFVDLNIQSSDLEDVFMALTYNRKGRSKKAA